MRGTPCELVAAMIERELPNYEGRCAGLPGDVGRHEYSAAANMAAHVARTTGRQMWSVHRRIQQIRQKKYATIEFRTMDWLLTGLGLTHLWYTDFADYYHPPRERAA